MTNIETITQADDDGDFVLSDGDYGNPGCDSCGTFDAVVKIDDTYFCEGCDPRLSFPGPISDALPADERGVSRSDVWEQHGQQGDYSVGREWETRYAVGDTRVELIIYIEDLRLLRNLDEDDPEWAEEEYPFILQEVTRVFTVRPDPDNPDDDGITNDDDEYDYEMASPFGYQTLDEAEAKARSIADQDWRMAISA